MRILYVEDHAMVREALTRLIESAIEDAQVIAVGTATEARKHLRWAERLLLNLCLPDLHGLRFLEQVRRELPKLPVVILSDYDELAFRNRAAELGVRAFVPKKASFAELLASLRDPDEAASEWGGGMEELSPTEREVLLLLGRGCTNAEAADRLEMDEKTVYSHRRHLMFKLGLSGAQELIRYATLYVASLD